MKKSNFITLILGTINGLFFALGMCMALLPEWNMTKQGAILGAVGIILALITVAFWRKAEKKAPIKVSPKAILTTLVSVIGALLLGVGMSFCMVFAKMILGIVIGVIGIIVLLMLIPMTKGLHD